MYNLEPKTFYSCGLQAVTLFTVQDAGLVPRQTPFPYSMSFEPSLIVELALLGLATGFLAGLLGIGGGAFHHRHSVAPGRGQ